MNSRITSVALIAVILGGAFFLLKRKPAVQKATTPKAATGTEIPTVKVPPSLDKIDAMYKKAKAAPSIAPVTLPGKGAAPVNTADLLKNMKGVPRPANGGKPLPPKVPFDKLVRYKAQPTVNPGRVSGPICPGPNCPVPDLSPKAIQAAASRPNPDCPGPHCPAATPFQNNPSLPKK